MTDKTTETKPIYPFSRTTSERSLYPSLIEHAKTDAWFLYRIEDAGSNKKPFDIGGFTKDGKAVALEVKITDQKKVNWVDFEINENKPPVNLFSSHQLAWLNKCAGSGGMALFVVYYNQKNLWAFWRLQFDGTFILTQMNSLEHWTVNLQ